MSAAYGGDTHGTTHVAAWRRIVARLLDAVWQLPAGALACYVAAQLAALSWLWLIVVAALATSCVQAIGETLLVWGLATTPGKAATGLQVVDPQSDGLPTFRMALLRALKVSAWGLAFWLGPLAVGAAAIGLWRLSSGRRMPWERGGESTVVCLKPCPARRHFAAWSTSAILMVIASTGPLLMLIGPAASSAQLSQELRRSISGNWLWLNPLTGKTFTLDARWRLVNEDLHIRSKLNEAVFALDEGTTNLVKLDVSWGGLGNLALCSHGQFDLEGLGLVVMETGAFQDQATHAACTLQAGGIRSGEVVFGLFRALRKANSGVSHSVLLTHTGEKASVRRDVENLANQLMADAGSVESSNGALPRYFWRNGLTGKVAELPSGWVLAETTISEGDVVGYIFVRDSQRFGIAHKDSVLITGLPLSDQPEFEAKLQKELARIGDGIAPLQPALTSGGGTLYTFKENGVEGRIAFRKGRYNFWLLIWANNESATPPGNLEEHPVLNRLIPTLQ